MMDKASNYFLLTEMFRGMYVVLEQFFRPPYVTRVSWFRSHPMQCHTDLCNAATQSFILSRKVQFPPDFAESTP